MQKIIVASKNPVKINAVKLGFENMFSDKRFEMEGLSVPSGVRDQPMDDEETLRGAKQRAGNAREALPAADYWIGVEGGIETQGDGFMAFAWVYVLGKEQQSCARSSAFLLPPKVSELIRQGMELGAADDVVFGESNSKQKGGAVGLLTNDRMDRTKRYADTVMLSLIPFLHPALYPVNSIA